MVILLLYILSTLFLAFHIFMLLGSDIMYFWTVHTEKPSYLNYFYLDLQYFYYDNIGVLFLLCVIFIIITIVLFKFLKMKLRDLFLLLVLIIISLIFLLQYSKYWNPHG